MTITFPSTIQIQIALFEYNSHFVNTIHIFFEYDSCFLNTIHAQNATLIPFQIKRRVHDFQLNETEYDLAMIHIFPTNHAILHDFNQLRVRDAMCPEANHFTFYVRVQYYQLLTVNT